jgi:hypothetical protein
MSKNIDQNTRVPLSALPPLSLDLFLQQSGFSPATAWRYRKKGWLRTVVIGGRHYISRSAIAEFNERAEQGEFAGTIQNHQRIKQRSVRNQPAEGAK